MAKLAASEAATAISHQVSIQGVWTWPSPSWCRALPVFRLLSPCFLS